MLDRRLGLDSSLVFYAPLRRLDGDAFMSKDQYGSLCTNTGGLWKILGMLFSGAEFISTPDRDRFSFGDGTSDSPFSISAWVNMDDATNFYIALKGVYNTDGEWWLNTEADDKIYFYIADESVSSTWQRVYCNTTLTSYEGIWIHLVVTYDGRGGTSAYLGMNIYLNGIQIDDEGGAAGTYVAMENLDHDVWIGRYSAIYSNGKIGDVKIFNREFSGVEIRRLFEREKRLYM